MSDLLIKRLRGQRLDGRSPVDCMVDAADEIESLRARLAEAEANGERYRWLRAQPQPGLWGRINLAYADLDFAIDAAMPTDQPPGVAK